MENDRRLNELELRNLEQEKLLQELNEMVYAQGRAIERLTAALAELQKKVTEPGFVEAGQERPPHY
jgi:uncharacterized coiled-coil protein SlyX